jgi:hypothetical protein
VSVKVTPEDTRSVLPELMVMLATEAGLLVTVITLPLPMMTVEPAGGAFEVSVQPVQTLLPPFQLPSL